MGVLLAFNLLGLICRRFRRTSSSKWVRLLVSGVEKYNSGFEESLKCWSSPCGWHILCFRVFPSSVFMGYFVLSKLHPSCFRCNLRVIHTVLEKLMRRIYIGEVGQLLEHVLLMPIEPLWNLIIWLLLCLWSHSSGYYIGCYPIVAWPLILLPPYLPVIREDQRWRHPSISFPWVGLCDYLIHVRSNALGTGWSRDHTDYPYHLLSYYEYEL